MHVAASPADKQTPQQNWCTFGEGHNHETCKYCVSSKKAAQARKAVLSGKMSTNDYMWILGEKNSPEGMNLPLRPVTYEKRFGAIKMKDLVAWR